MYCEIGTVTAKIPHWRLASVGSGNGFGAIRRRAVTWTNVDQVLYAMAIINKIVTVIKMSLHICELFTIFQTNAPYRMLFMYCFSIWCLFFTRFLFLQYFIFTTISYLNCTPFILYLHTFLMYNRFQCAAWKWNNYDSFVLHLFLCLLDCQIFCQWIVIQNAKHLLCFIKKYHTGRILRTVLVLMIQNVLHLQGWS